MKSGRFEPKNEDSACAELPRAGRLELEEHRHHVAAQPEEDALPQAQDAAVAPDQHDADRAETRSTGTWPAGSSRKSLERQRQHDQQQHGQDREAVASSQPAAASRAGRGRRRRAAMTAVAISASPSSRTARWAGSTAPRSPAAECGLAPSTRSGSTRTWTAAAPMMNADRQRAEQALDAAEHHHDEGVDDVLLAGHRAGGGEHGERAAGDAGQSAAEREGLGIDLVRC